MRHSRSILVACVIWLGFSVSSVCAGKEDKPRIPSKPSKIIDVKLNLVPFVTGGMVVGDAAQQIELAGGSTIEKVLYGGGVSLSFYPRPRYAVALNLEYAFKELPGEDVKTGRGWFYSGSFIYNLRTLVKYVTYARADLGFVSGKWPRAGSDLDVGTHPFFRLGLGVFTYTSHTINTRVEAYFVHAFSKGHKIADWNDYEIDYDAQCFGVEFGIGFPLSTR